MATRYSDKNIAALQNRKVFFDANVLIYLFWSSGSTWEKPYAKVFNTLRKQNNEFLVDFLVVSEIINRARHLEYERYLDRHSLLKINLPYKQYRDSTDGKKDLSDIHFIIEKDILSRFSVVGKAFSKTEIQSFLSIQPLDFTDKAIVLTCQENACILLTNDKDYKAANIDTLTCNPHLY